MQYNKNMQGIYRANGGGGSLNEVAVGLKIDCP